MKTNPVYEVSKDKACAYCTSSYTQNQVRRFIGSDDRWLHLCNSCVIKLRRRADNRILCAFCGRRCEFATWELETTRGMGDRSFSDGTHVPEHWLLCEKHFSEMYEEAKERVTQSQLEDF